MNSIKTPDHTALNLKSLKQLWLPILAMVVVVVASNYLVQFPLNEWLTLGAFTFPVAFLVTDLTNRALGATAARRVAFVGQSLWSYHWGWHRGVLLWRRA